MMRRTALALALVLLAAWPAPPPSAQAPPFSVVEAGIQDMQAAMTQGILETSKEAKLPEGQNPQNIEFIKAHKAELDAIAKDMGMNSEN